MTNGNGTYTPGSGKPASSPLIFLAEDDTDDQELLIEAITMHLQTARVETASNGKKAITQLMALPAHDLPCLIILDYNLPEVNGGEILKLLASESRFSSVPKVVWSTSNSPLYRQICMDLGARAYFVKPSDIRGIERMAHEMLAYCDLVPAN